MQAQPAAQETADEGLIQVTDSEGRGKGKGRRGISKMTPSRLGNMWILDQESKESRKEIGDFEAR